MIVDKEILSVFTSFDDLLGELVADKLPSIVVMGGQCSSRVAVVNELLGGHVLPQPCDSTPWHTLQFVDTDCVCSFKTADSSTLWSWVDTVPLVDVQLIDSLVKSSSGSVSECTHVLKILLSHCLLKAGSQLVVCADDCVSSVQFAVADVIPIIIFVISGHKLSEKVRRALSSH